MIHKDDYRDWKNHPITEVFFNNLGDILADIEEAMLNGYSVESHPILAQQLGLIRAYRSVIEYAPDFDENDYMVDDNGDIIE